MIRRFVVLAAVLGGFGFALTSVAQAGDPGTPHYPDIQTLKPTGMRVTHEGNPQRTYLRFTNIIANLGSGPLEIHGVNNPNTGNTDAFQSVKTHNASGTWSEYSRTPAGSFEFHPSHNHWHFSVFARYELRSVTAKGGIGPTIWALSDKVSFCVVDYARFNSTLEHAGPRTYVTCNQTAMQGLANGWADLYTWDLPGQELDITDVPNGTYWLVSTADPQNRLLETNNANNRAVSKVRLTHQP